MTTIVTPDQYKKLLKKPPKYRAKPTVIDGIRFHSQRESQFYIFLKRQKESGVIWGFLMQIPFRLPGGVRYYLDFMVFHSGGFVEYFDCKGMATQTYIIKKKQVEELYPWVKIKEV